MKYTFKWYLILLTPQNLITNTLTESPYFSRQYSYLHGFNNNEPCIVPEHNWTNGLYVQGHHTVQYLRMVPIYSDMMGPTLRNCDFTLSTQPLPILVKVIPGKQCIVCRASKREKFTQIYS